MQYEQQLLWIIYPYICLTIFVVGHIYRYNTDQLGWSAQSSEFLEKNLLKWGSISFHYGIIFAFGGHIMGVVTPAAVWDYLGITREFYHLIALSGGMPAGILVACGIILLLFRRISAARILRQMESIDWIVGVLLAAVIFLGLSCTLGYTMRGLAFDYRTTIGPWFRGLLFLTPNPAYMVNVPMVFQLHILTAFLLFALWPFTRLVHIWSLPIEYVVRRYILFKSTDRR